VPVDPGSSEPKPSSTTDGTGHLKGAPRVTPTPGPAALIPTVDHTDAIDVPDVDAAWDIVDQWGEDSFPASDPPANW
jgi:hypothetical protein